jgi:uncharacterized membrane protein
MKPLTLIALVPLAGCAATPAPEAGTPAASADYVATSHDPFWTVAISKDSILMTRGPAGGRADGELTSVAYPAAIPSEQGGARRWESGEGTTVIAIESRPAPCTTGGRSYPDQVKVYLSGVMLEGCGGQEIGP